MSHETRDSTRDSIHGRSHRPRNTIFGPYRLTRTLGEGEFGKVKEGFHTQDGHIVAVKLIRKDSVDTTSRLNKIEREISVLRVLKHPNIVKLYDVIETEKYIGIILECAEGGEVFELIIKHRQLREDVARTLFAQLVSGVNYMHKKNIVHRDLKLENLLLAKSGDILITDFGFANQFKNEEHDLMATSCGSPCYAAPELVMSEGTYVGTAVDVWSCGVILYAMVAGYLPYDDDPNNPEGDNINVLYRYITNTKLVFPPHMSEEIKDLISHMLVVDPQYRCSLEYAMQHPWLNRPDTQKILREPTAELEKRAMKTHTTSPTQQKKSKREARELVRSPSAKTTASHSNYIHAVTSHGDREDDDDDDLREGPKRHTIQVEYETEHIAVLPTAPVPTTVTSYVTDDNLIVIEGEGSRKSSNGSSSIGADTGMTTPDVDMLDYTQHKPMHASAATTVADKHKSVPLPTVTTNPVLPGDRAMTMNSASAGLFTLVEGDTPKKSSKSASSLSVPGSTPPRRERRDATPPSPQIPSKTSIPAKGSPVPEIPGRRDSLSVPFPISNRPRSSSAVVPSKGGHKRGLSRDRLFGFLQTNSSKTSIGKADMPNDALTKSNRNSANVALKSPSTTSSPKKEKSARRKAMSLVVDPFRFATPSASTMPKKAFIEPSMLDTNERPTTSSDKVAPNKLTRRHVEPMSNGAAKASSGPAKRVMDWFRRKSIAKGNNDDTSFVMVDPAPPPSMPTPRVKSSMQDSARLPPATISQPLPPPFDDSRLKFHHGAVDQSALTYRQPDEMWGDVERVLAGMRLHFIREGSDFKLRVLRRRRYDADLGRKQAEAHQAAVDDFMRPASSSGKRRKYSTSSILGGNGLGGGKFRSLLGRRGTAPSMTQPPYHAAASSSTSLPMDQAAQAISPPPMSPITPVTPGLHLDEPIYGDITVDSGDEIRFTVELCRIKGLPGLYILDMRRMKGNLWGYKFLYHTLLERCDFGPNGYAV